MCTQVLNLPQRLMQRFLAPRAQTQSAMNAHFQGLPWHLAERYTELGKVDRLCVMGGCGYMLASSAGFQQGLLTRPCDTENRPCLSPSSGRACSPRGSLSQPLRSSSITGACVCVRVLCSSWRRSTALISLKLTTNHDRADKYALFNLWRRPPALNGRLVTLSRSMLMFTIFVHVVMSRIFFGNW